MEGSITKVPGATYEVVTGLVSGDRFASSGSCIRWDSVDRPPARCVTEKWPATGTTGTRLLPRTDGPVRRSGNVNDINSEKYGDVRRSMI